MNTLKKEWNSLNGDIVINSLECNWTQWDVNDTIKWFKYVLSSNYDVDSTNTIIDKDNNYNAAFDDDYVIENLSDSESDDSDTGGDNDYDDDEKKYDDKTSGEMIDFKMIERRLIDLKFRAKNRLPLIKKSFQFGDFGFKNKNDRRLLCNQTKKLMKKYPKSKQNKKDKQIKVKNKQDLEGFVQDTQN